MNTEELRRQIGQRFVVGISGPTLDRPTRAALEELHAGGVILFRRNLGAPAQVAALTQALHALPSRPLVGIDHEGGRVMRLGEPFTQFSAAALVGRAGDVRLAYGVGQAMGAELASVGMDVDFAPVLDVDSNPANLVIGDRAFGSDPVLVSRMGVAMMRGLLAGGVVPCGKHFPGHGDTETDSHLELPVVRRSIAELERIELVPFRAAISAGMPMLMTAHVLYPALDADHPATLSSVILRDLLREQLGFAGVIVSDDLEMRAVGDQYDIGDAAIASLDAGADVLLVCQDLNKAVHAVTAVERAVRCGVLATEVITAAADRVQRLRTLRAGLSRPAIVLPNPEHQCLEAALSKCNLP